MATITRRGWSLIQDEAQRRLAGIASPGFTARIDYWVWAAYQQICLTYHHFELDSFSTSLSIALGASTLALPADCYAVIAMTLRDGTGAYAGEVRQYELAAVRGAYVAASGRPSRRARFGSTLYLDMKADQLYNVDLFYYRFPTAPDFATNTAPETASDVDEHIIEGAVRLAHPAIGRSDLGDVDRQLLADWLSQQIRPSLNQETLEDTERAGAERTLGGAQG